MISTKFNDISIIWKLTGTAIFCSLVVVLIAIWVSYDTSKELLIDDAREVMTVSLDRQVNRINNAVETVKKDVLYISNSESINAFARAEINNGIDPKTGLNKEELQEKIEKYFQVFMQAKGYDHIRFIRLDEFGQELIRVDAPNLKDTLFKFVRGKDLQQKGQKEYIIKGYTLLPNEVFISTINLNREHGQIEIPYQPTQRYVTPVYIQRSKLSNKISSRIIDLMGKVKYYDEVLTMSALAAAHSGDVKWENRYRKNEALLDAAIKEVAGLLGEKVSKDLEQIDYANVKLIELEKTIFKLVALNDLENAQRVISSEQYLKYKDIYNSSLENFFANTENTKERCEVFGLIVINTDANKLIDQIEIDELFDVFLINNSGGLIHHPDPNRIWGFEFGLNNNLLTDEPFLWDKLQKGAEKLFYEKDHTEFHTMSKIYLNPKDTSEFLGVVITADEKDILASVAQLRTKVTLITLFSVLFMIALMYFMLRKVMTPITALTKQANLLAAGDENVKLEYSGSNEVGLLGLAFSNMVEKLQLKSIEVKQNAQEIYLLNESLEEKVEQRTVELEHAVKNSQMNEYRFQTMIDSNSDGIIALSLSGTISIFNPAAEKMFGYSSSDIIGWSIQDLFPESYHERYQRIFSSYISLSEKQANKIKAFEFYAMRSDGSNFPIELILTSGGDGEDKFILVVIRDITKRKEIESVVAKKSTEQRVINDLLRISLQQNSLEEKLKLSLEVIFDSSFFDFKKTGAIFLADNKKEELNLTTQFNLEAPILKKCLKIPFGKCLCGRTAKEKEIQFTSCLDDRHEITFDGIQEHGHYNVPILSENELLGILVLYLEHNHEKNDDDIKFLESISQILASIIKKEYADIELIESRKQAEKANKSKGEFLANMSHEIRTPMNGVLGMTALALDSDLNVEQREYMLLVKNSADNLLIILNEILDFSKIEAGQLHLEEIEFDLLSELEPCVAPLAIRTYEKDLNFILSVNPDMPSKFIGDPLRIRQIITNLIGNAIKFTEQGHLSLEVSYENEESISELHFKISDTGIGIPKEKHKSIFDSFSQVDSSTTRRYGGTGLGVTICKQIVELMGGNIWIESPSNKTDEGGPGTTIHFRIPIENYSEVNPNFDSPLAKLEQSKRILIIDTNEMSRLYYRDLFESHRCQVSFITDYKIENDELDAFVKKEVGSQDIIFVNLTAVDTHIIDTFNVVHKFADQTEVPVILLYPANLKKSIQLSGLQESYAIKLHKPIRLSVFIETIYKQLLPKTDTSEPTETTVRKIAVDSDNESIKKQFKILVAEDNKINQILIKKLLAKQGYDFVVVDNGRMAVDEVMHNEYDLVIMDIQMPVMGGLEASLAIRANEQETDRHIPIIAMTANAMAGDKEKCLNNGMDEYISKPVNAKVLYDCLEAYLRQKERIQV